MTEHEKIKLDNEVNLLKSNLNRICVTNDIDELNKMMFYLKERLEKIYNLNDKRIEDFYKNKK